MQLNIINLGRKSKDNIDNRKQKNYYGTFTQENGDLGDPFTSKQT